MSGLRRVDNSRWQYRSLCELGAESYFGMLAVFCAGVGAHDHQPAALPRDRQYLVCFRQSLRSIGANQGGTWRQRVPGGSNEVPLQVPLYVVVNKSWSRWFRSLTPCGATALQPIIRPNGPKHGTWTYRWYHRDFCPTAIPGQYHIAARYSTLKLTCLRTASLRWRK